MSEYKEIDVCVKELGDCYDKLYERFCEGTNCMFNMCVMSYGSHGCLLIDLLDLIEALEEK